MKFEKRKLTEEEIMYKKTMLEEYELNKLKSEFEIERLEKEIERIRKMQEKDFFVKQLISAIHQEQDKIRNCERNIKILTRQIREKQEDIISNNGGEEEGKEEGEEGEGEKVENKIENK